MKINVYVVRNIREDFKLLVVASDRQEALEIAKNYFIDSDIDCEELSVYYFTNINTQFDCDYAATKAQSKKYVLIRSNDFYNVDNIEGRLQTEIYDSYEKAYNVMQTEVINKFKLNDEKWQDYIASILDHIEFSNVYLGTWSARINSNFYGNHNMYWKIVEV